MFNPQVWGQIPQYWQHCLYYVVVVASSALAAERVQNPNAENSKSRIMWKNLQNHTVERCRWFFFFFFSLLNFLLYGVVRGAFDRQKKKFENKMMEKMCRVKKHLHRLSCHDVNHNHRQPVSQTVISYNKVILMRTKQISYNYSIFNIPCSRNNKNDG